MGLLALASVIWAFSFGLIAPHLRGADASVIAATRLGLSALVFLPLLRPSRIPRGLGLRLVLLGAVQYGPMYVLYLQSYRHPPGHEVASLTAMTPLHVVLIDGALRRRLAGRALLGAGLAIAGAAVIALGPWERGGLRGVLLVQAANLCFAGGQVLYARWSEGRDLDHAAHFALLYLGAFALTGVLALGNDPVGVLRSLDGPQLWTLAYLGLVASGLGFFLWNVGASRVRAPTLAVFNNAKIPLAVLVALTVFGEEANIRRLLAGSLLIAGGFAITLSRSRPIPSSR